MTDASRWQSIPTTWDILHTQPRHQTRYPSEHAVRFLANATPPNRRALDIGSGSGRHTKLMLEHSYVVTAVDASAEAVNRTKSWRPAVAKQASMTSLPFEDNTFGIAIAFGVFYYGTTNDHELAVAELHRVLAPGGQALVVHRSTRDARQKHTNRHGRFSLPNHPEDGMNMNFIYPYNLELYYARFASLRYELTETTRNDRTWRDSDWLITVTK